MDTSTPNQYPPSCIGENTVALQWRPMFHRKEVMPKNDSSVKNSVSSVDVPICRVSPVAQGTTLDRGTRTSEESLASLEDDVHVVSYQDVPFTSSGIMANWNTGNTPPPMINQAVKAPKHYDMYGRELPLVQWSCSNDGMGGFISGPGLNNLV